MIETKAIDVMEVWVISNHDDMATRVCASLARPELGGVNVRVMSASTSLHKPAEPIRPEYIVFYVASELGVPDFAAIRQVWSTTRASLAVVSPLSDNAIVLRAIRAGAADFLDANGDLDQEVSDFLAKVQAEKSVTPKSGQLLGVLSASSSADSSILATNLAALLARKHTSSILLDFHRHGGDLALLLEIAPRHTLADLSNQQHGIDKAMFQQALAHHESGVRLLAGPKCGLESSPVHTALYQDVIDLACETHPCAIVSSDDAQNLCQLTNVTDFDRVIFTIRLDILSLHRTQRVLEHVQRIGLARDRLEVVAIAAGQIGELPPAAVAKSLGLSHIHLIPDDPIINTVSINLGRPFVLESPSSPASLAMRQFVAYLCGDEAAKPSLRFNGPLATVKTAAADAMNALLGRLQAQTSSRSGT